MSDDDKSVETNQSTLSPDFCAGDADVRFLSSDNVEFRIHSNNLNVTCGGFPPSEFKNAEGEFVHLSEESETLGILFQFVYPRRHPDLHGIKFGLLEKVAEAAEKYEVFAAMSLCELHMSRFCSSHPLKVFAYALKHNHPMVADLCAPSVLECSLPEVVNKISLDYYVRPWVEYQSLWSEAINSTFSPNFLLYAPYTKWFPGPRERKLVPAKTYITESVMDHALANLKKQYPNQYPKESILEAFRDALIGQGHEDPTYKEETEAPTAEDMMFQNSIQEFARLLEANTARIPKFSQFLKDRQARS